jgi:predicted MFS family arabinose efflux permease
VVLPIYAVERLALDSQGYGLLLGVMGVGALVASPPLAYLDAVAARRTVLVASIGVAVAVLVLALTTFAPLAFLVVGVAGAASNAALSSASVVLQHAVHGDLRARVLGLQAALFQGGQGIGGYGMGLATESLGIVTALVWGALLVGLSTLVVWPTWRATPPPGSDATAPPSRAPAGPARPRAPG